MYVLIDMGLAAWDLHSHKRQEGTISKKLALWVSFNTKNQYQLLWINIIYIHVWDTSELSGLCDKKRNVLCLLVYLLRILDAWIVCYFVDILALINILFTLLRPMDLYHKATYNNARMVQWIYLRVVHILNINFVKLNSVDPDKTIMRHFI